jgi:hypothetical protein
VTRRGRDDEGFSVIPALFCIRHSFFYLVIPALSRNPSYPACVKK